MPNPSCCCPKCGYCQGSHSYPKTPGGAYPVPLQPAPIWPYPVWVQPPPYIFTSTSTTNNKTIDGVAMN